MYIKAAFKNDDTANADQPPDLNELDWNTLMPVRYEGESMAEQEQERSDTIAKNSQDDETTTIDDQSQTITWTQDTVEASIADKNNHLQMIHW